jgi:uncharacterized protein YkwD
MRLPLAIALASLSIASPALAGIDIAPPDPNKMSDSQRERASKLYQELKKHPEDYRARTGIIKEMCELGRPVAQKMFDTLDRQWAPKWNAYRSAFVTAAKKAATKKTTGTARQEITKLSAQVRSLRAKGDALSKNDIVKIGDPALARLKVLKSLTIPEILAENPGLGDMRDEILEIAKQRDYCIEALLLLDDEAKPFGSADFKQFEEQSATAALGPPAEHIAILRQNVKIGRTIPAAEAAAIYDMNRYRMFIGLRPCVIDPKLCDASRGHSKDMSERGFFAHDSPVPGKETPWKRAALAGTKSNGENIFVGSSDGKSANRGWWHSPGHHRNMLNPGARRVGMGVHGKHWTQMLGG